MSFSLGLTGSIGMGKSTTARLFAEAGCDVWDADAAVHRLYEIGGAAVEPMRTMFPSAIVDGKVDRSELKRLIGEDPAALNKIEAIVHPLVAQDREEFRSSAKADILVFDIPLLFESGGNATMDAVVCVSVSPDLQERRVLERGTMSREQFEHVRNKQMPDDEKRARSDYVIVTDTLEHARRQVQEVLADIRARMTHA